MSEGASSAAATVSMVKIKIHLQVEYKCVHNAYTSHTLSPMLGQPQKPTIHNIKRDMKKATYMHQPSVFIPITNNGNKL